MDKDTYYDIPIFKSLPEKIETNKVTFDKLNKISIVDMYMKEPFTNNINYDMFILIFFFILIFIYVFLFIFFEKY